MITNCSFQSNKYGIKEDDGGDPDVSGCSYTGNTIDYYDYVSTRVEQN